MWMKTTHTACRVINSCWIGRKTIETFAAEVGKTPDEVMKILQENEIKAEKGQTLREIGDNNNIPPKEIFELFSK